MDELGEEVRLVQAVQLRAEAEKSHRQQVKRSAPFPQTSGG